MNKKADCNEFLPGPMTNIIKVNGIMMQKASMSRHPRRRRGDAVSAIFIVAIFKNLNQIQIINKFVIKTNNIFGEKWANVYDGYFELYTCVQVHL